jgi:predicted nuclease of predicted toxin-antitoxin system
VTLLFDQNLSHRLVMLLAGSYPGSVHVRDVGLARSRDEEVWTYAAHNAPAIVSKDADFAMFSAVRGHPPKVIWIRRGNCTTDVIASMLRAQQAHLNAFLHDSASDCLQLL